MGVPDRNAGGHRYSVRIRDDVDLGFCFAVDRLRPVSEPLFRAHARRIQGRCAPIEIIGGAQLVEDLSMH
ncbi:hypothetical protein [Nocardia sp. X0981]